MITFCSQIYDKNVVVKAVESFHTTTVHNSALTYLLAVLNQGSQLVYIIIEINFVSPLLFCTVTSSWFAQVTSVGLSCVFTFYNAVLIKYRTHSCLSFSFR